MSLQELRHLFIGQNAQICLFGTEGKLIESCNTVFDFRSVYGNDLVDVFGFLVGMEEEIFRATEDSPFSLPGILISLAGKDRYCDFEFKMLKQEKPQLLVIIQDVTELYGTLRDINQKKSEAMIENHLVMIQKENLQAHTRKLEQLNAELDRFAYVVSHDLKAPLRGIRNLVEFIKEDIGDGLPEIVEENMVLLTRQVDKMASLINGILEFSRAGRTQNQLGTVDLNQLIPEIVANISLPENITVKVQENLPEFETYPMFLEQVFTNLISNAFKHHPGPEGLIEISYREIPGELYEFKVKDDGEGIAKEYHTRIFEMFERLETRDPLQSTGIGLSIVLKLVREIGGKVWVESELGKGASFIFTWPQKVVPV